MDINTQNNYNNYFLTKYKNKVKELNINTNYLLEKLIEFEKKEINDNIVKNLIKYMLTVPYYENLKEVNDLKKFKIMIEQLRIFKGELIEIELYQRLEKLKQNTNKSKIRKLLIN